MASIQDKIYLWPYLAVRFYLQNSMFREWSRGDSNPRPPPCKIRGLLSWTFAVVQKYLQIGRFLYSTFHDCSPLFTWVGVLLVYKRNIKKRQLAHSNSAPRPR